MILGLHSYALTLIESLSTLAVMGEAQEFRTGVDWVATNIKWNNAVVSVFEVNIRVLGGSGEGTAKIPSMTGSLFLLRIVVSAHARL